MIDFEELEDTLFDVVKTSTGYADDNILFEDQDGISPQPTPYVTIRMGDLIKIGDDSSSHDYDAARPTGQEIRRTTAGMREMAVRFSVYTPSTTGSSTARTVAAKLEADLSLISVREVLNAVGLGVLKTGNVRWVPKLDETDFEGRAVLETLFVLSQGTSDNIGWIETAEVTPTINDVVLPVVVLPTPPFEEP